MAELRLVPQAPSVTRLEPSSVYRERFESEGFLLLKNVVERAPLAALSSELVAHFHAEKAAGVLFDGGGTLSGHLNCFPGAASRFVYRALEAHGVFELVASLADGALRAPYIGCNLNLPGSHAQNLHVDGYASAPFLIVNVAAVDTDEHNGAMEIVRHTHGRPFKYWEIALRSADRRRVPLSQGDVLVRTSTLWHRGMPNHSPTPRPMLAFTWEAGGNNLEDPYAVHGGRVTFLPNRYRTDWKGKLVERAFVTAPRLSTMYRTARSLFE